MAKLFSSVVEHVANAIEFDNAFSNGLHRLSEDARGFGADQSDRYAKEAANALNRANVELNDIWESAKELVAYRRRDRAWRLKNKARYVAREQLLRAMES